MTYAERFKNGVEYGKFEAQKRLELYKTYGEICYNGNVKINLLTVPDCYIGEKARKQKQKALENIKQLEKIVDGEIIDPIYIYYFEHQKNAEWNELRG